MNASAERSFSALKMFKTYMYLRITTSDDERLSHLANGNAADSADLEQVLDMFIKMYLNCHNIVLK